MEKPSKQNYLPSNGESKERSPIQQFLTTETGPSFTKSSRATISELFAKLMTESPSDIDKPKHDESYKFWKTQPVPQFNENGESKGGPIKVVNQDEVPKEPYPLLDGFEWGTIDPENEKEVGELYELLSNHYVEDDDSSFRLNYSPVFLRWSVNSFLIKVFFHHTHQMTRRALTAPGWQKQWNIAVRASASQKLVAFITGVSTNINVYAQAIKVIEINFLCIHKKLRSKRLTPLLIKEITRRCYLQGIYQAIYTAAAILPTPLPANSTKARQIAKYHLPSITLTPGLRLMQADDLDAVHELLEWYQQRFDIGPAFSIDELRHWLLEAQTKASNRVVWAYVVEDLETRKITDLVSFYCIDSAVLSHSRDVIRTAYLYYYATENTENLQERLQGLINDALILAKKAGLDVFNALHLQDNELFLEKLRFGRGDGQLHYYLFNYLGRSGGQ
ncbi:Glycylpeptide N-tetradecanoyltransferase [Penicillium longicatenatum]|uniref:Glycylpeptide N-tetradecanoyltransferase n=1 Tax=Penicillium longicatenatum TaxID=1561947 RepID=UPI0025484FCE|nr:Glycylpeptide N-tetradecanoyltransferase [Penicillium longicatenatum]KAJ5649280.1 Glycylpeptide N-tetradecanoyltransferase [Penicillium longicatenatum]